MKKIILDTNFVLIPAQFNVDIFSEIDRICNFEYSLCVLDKTFDELKNIIEKQRGKHKQAALLALKLLKAKKVKVVRTKEDKSVDELLIDLAKDKDVIVATQDRLLKKKLKKPVIMLRQRRYLKMFS